MNFIISSRLPFRVVEQVHFKRLINLVAPSSLKVSFPSRNTIKQHLMELADISQDAMMKQFPESHKISIALDCWTSPDQKPFLAMTGYFITTDFNFQEVLLGFVPLSGAHTGDQLAHLVLEVLKKHNLLYRVLGITTDNVSHFNHGYMKCWII